MAALPFASCPKAPQRVAPCPKSAVANIRADACHDLQARTVSRDKLAPPARLYQLLKIIMGVKFIYGIEVIRWQAQTAAA